MIFRRPLKVKHSVKRARRTFYNIFFSILAVLSLVLIISTLVFYHIFEGIFTKELHNKSVNNLAQIQSVFSAVHASIIPSVIQLSREKNISKIMYSADFNKLLLSRVGDRLYDELVANPLLQSIFIYNHRKQTVYSTRFAPQKIEYCSDIQLPHILSNVREYGGIHTYIPRKMLILSGDDIDTVNVFTILQGTPPYSGNSLKGALIANVSERKLRELFLSNSTHLQGELIVIDRKGLVLSHPQTQEFQQNYSDRDFVRKILSQDSKEGTFISAVNGIKCLVTYVTHREMGWRFISIVPYDEVFQGLHQARNRTLVIFIFFLCSAAVFTFITSKLIYSPIARLFQSASMERYMQSKGAPELKKVSELQYLDQILKDSFRQLDSLKNYVQVHKRLHRQELLRNLIDGNIAITDFMEDLEELGLDIQRSEMLLIVLRFDCYREIRESFQNDKLQKLHHQLADFIASRAAFRILVIDMGSDHFVLLLELKGKADQEDQIRNVELDIRCLQDELNHQYSISFTAGCSTQFDTYHELRNAYCQALNATQYRFRIGPGFFIRFQDLKDILPGKYRFSERKAEILFSALKAGDAKTVEKLLDEIIEEVKQYSYEDFVYMTQLLIYHSAKVFASFSGFRPYVDWDEFNNLSHSYDRFETALDVKRILMQYYQEFISLVKTRPFKKRQEIALIIQDYIEKHLDEPGLCSDEIAVQLKLSTNYVRSIFKEVTGKSLPGYINSMRVERCQRLIETTDLTVKEIYKEAGFSNYNYFFTIFKKSTGVTPLEYRRNRLR